MKNLIRFFVCAALFFLPLSLFAQQKFSAVHVENNTSKSLATHFTKYALFSINTSEIKQYAKEQQGGNIDFRLELPGYATWHVSVTEKDILSKDYLLTVTSAAGRSVLPKPGCMTYAGSLDDAQNSRVSLTLTEDLIYGMIKNGNKEYFIEPLNYFYKDATPGIYVVYETSDVLFDPALTCGVTEMRSEQQKLYPPATTDNAGLTCVINELAIASDASMFTRYGTVAAVQAHNIGVINNVIWDYVNAQFNNNIEIVIVAQNVSTTVSNDQLTPAYTGTNSNTILSNFTAWGQAGGFGATFDDAEFWTTRNIDADGIGGNNGIIGLAWVGVICTTSRYHILEDFAGSNPTGSGYQLRVLTSHEMGHNFSASHDAAGSAFIMAPSVQSTSLWSAASISSIDGHVGTRACLASCSTAGIPVANFIYAPGGICTGGTLQFLDHSLHGPTSWAWNFTGGTPATSTSRNPSASFATTGLKNVSMTSTNGAGSNTKSKLILVSASPTAACINTGTGTSNAGINSFNLAGINKSTAGLATDGNKYLDFSCSDNTILYANTTYTVNVNVGTTIPANEFNLVQLFIDYNNDGDFIDAGEAIYSSPSCYIGTHTFTFITPAAPSVMNQFLRMRVIAKDCIGGVNSCYNVTAGQVEDYAVFFPNATLLPVTLLNFDGVYQGGKNILNWRTSNEINSDHFNIERSVDGTVFENIGRVNNTGNLSTISRYNFVDALQGMIAYDRFYYRLKIIDRDGHFTYSNIIVLNKTNGLVTIYPNPVKAGELLQVDLRGTRAERVDIINSLGQVVFSRQNELLQGNISIKTSAVWPAGQYMVRISEGRKIITFKIMVQ